MGFATALSVSLHGAVGHLIDVQVDVSPGQVGLTMGGRLDLALREGADRCRMAIVNSDLPWPSTKRITVLLSPADLHKRGSHFDLAMAVAVLGALDQLPREWLRTAVFIGELTLDGGLRSVPGVLPMVLAAADAGATHVFVPEPHAAEAAMVPGVEVHSARSLLQVVAELRGETSPPARPVAPASGNRLLAWRGAERLDDVDMSDLHGMEDAKYAVEVAAAGGHAVMLDGPKGAGKTSLAERIPGLLPDLAPDEALELTTIHSLAGALEPGAELMVRPRFAAPHHDASKASIVGGGTGSVRPGEISRAHLGVLFLDEFPLFRGDIIDALRQPLESGDITVARAEESVTLPARGLLVLACNPCPCGNYTAHQGTSRCDCRAQQLRDYRQKVTGPIADRIDITRHVEPLKPHDRDRFSEPERSETIRARVTAARARQLERFDGCGWRLNGHAPGTALRDRWPLGRHGRDLLDQKLYAGELTSRGAVRVHRLAWTIADLAAVELGHDVVPDFLQVEAALSLRLGEPLPLRALAPAERAG